MLTLTLNGAFLVIELGAGLYTGSLALLSDAAHMLSDVGALMLALVASRLAGRRATPDRSFGLVRAEPLGAFVNALLLAAASLGIIGEAVRRVAGAPPQIPGGPVLAVGAVGLLINLASVWVLRRADRHNLNIRAALLHMAADALGSLGAMLAALFLFWGIPVADPVISILLAMLVLWSASDMLRRTAGVLLQFAPQQVEVEGLRHALLGLPGVVDVHELHLWSLDGSDVVLSAHVVGRQGQDAQELRGRVEALLRRRFAVRHTTVQVECAEDCPQVCCPALPLASPPLRQHSRVRPLTRDC